MSYNIGFLQERSQWETFDQLKAEDSATYTNPEIILSPFPPHNSRQSTKANAEDANLTGNDCKYYNGYYQHLPCKNCATHLNSKKHKPAGCGQAASI